MEKLDYLKKDDLSNVLNYVVTKIEGKPYICVTKRVLLPSKYFDSIIYYASIIRCIVEKDNLIKFNEIIEESFYKWGDEFSLKQPTQEEYNNTQKMLSSGDDLYTILYIEQPVYSDSDTLIRVSNHNTDSLKDVLILSNQRFSYLYELIDELIKCQNDGDTYLNYDQMKTIADNYIDKRNIRKLIN